MKPKKPLEERKSVATIEKTPKEIEEFDKYIKADGYDSRAHFFANSWSNYIEHKRNGRKLVYPARYMTEDEKDLLAGKLPGKDRKRKKL